MMHRDSLTKPGPMKKEITFRKLRTLDIKALCNDIQESSLKHNLPKNLLELVEQYNNIIQDIFDKHAPVYKRTITIHLQAPWYNQSTMRNN